MAFFEQYGILPSESYFELLRYLLVLTFVIHVPYMSLVTGSTLLSLILNSRDRDVPNPHFARLAGDLMDMVMPSRVVVFVFGVLPLVPMWLIYGQWLYKSIANSMDLLPVGAALIAAALVAILFYKRTIRREGGNSALNFGIGSVGLLALLLGIYILVTSVVRFNDPERWHLAHDPGRLMVSFNVIWKYAYFVVGSVGATCCGTLFFFFHWPGCRPAMDARYTRFVKNFTAGLAIPCLALLPVVGLFYLVTTPIVALSGAIYALATASMALLFIIFIYLYRTLQAERPRFGAHAFVLFMGVLVLVAVGDQLSLVNATAEHAAARVAEAEEVAARIALEREAERAGAAKVDLARGEEVFNTVCTTCHRMDQRLVGPALETVLPKYAGRVDELIAFIRKPDKKDPDYPPMPAPALPLVDVKSVAAYLLGEAPDSGASPESGH
ncbi:MAG: c-type cytochrome [Candidatus Krumholzibacteriia bacterium]